MSIEFFIRKILGKKEFSLSSDIPTSYIIFRASIFVKGLVRGSYKKIGMKICGKKLFVGKQVLMLAKNKIYFGDNVRIENNVIIDALSIDGIRLGSRVKLGENTRIIGSGSLSNLGKGLSIGDDVSFAENSFFGAAGGIEIGNDVIGGQNIRFHSENHNFELLNIPIRLQGVNNQGIKVGNNVWIGAGTVFLDGAEVGDGCVIAANSVVNSKFPPNCIIAGVPSKIVRMRA